MSNDKDTRMTLKTEVTPTTGPVDRPSIETPADDDKAPVLGLFAVGFAVLGIFVNFLFVPLGLVLGIVALFIGQIGLGILAIVLSVIGVLTSPILLGMLGIGMLGAWLGFGG